MKCNHGLTPYELRFMLCCVRAFYDNDDGGYSCNGDDICNDGDMYDGNACNAHAHDNTHAHDASAVLAGGVLPVTEATEVPVAD
jgi:hypothetical protein